MPTLVAVIVAWAGWQYAAGVALDVGAPTDGAYLRGFFDREQGSLGTYRWSGPRARLWLPTARGPAVLALRLVGRPGGAPVGLALDDQPLTTLHLTDGPARRYLLLAGDTAPRFDTTRLTLTGSGAATAADPRDIVALVESVGLRSLPGMGWPPALPLLLLGALGALCPAILRLAGLGAAPALALGALAGAAFALGWGLARLWVAPFLLPVTLELAAVAGLLAGARWGARRVERLGPAELLGPFAAGAALIPLYLYVDYGWQSWLHWHNLPLLLLPLGLALPWLHGRARSVAAALILLASGGYALGMLYTIFSGDYARDFHAIYRGVAGLVRGDAPMYRLDDIRANPLGDTYKYPPIFALVFAPLTWLTFVPALMTWRVINLLLLIAAAGLLLRTYRARLRSWLGLALLLLLFSLRPLADTLGYGQVDLLLLLLLTAALQAVARRRDLALGAWIGAAAALKLYPAYLLGFALLQAGRTKNKEPRTKNRAGERKGEPRVRPTENQEPRTEDGGWKIEDGPGAARVPSSILHPPSSDTPSVVGGRWSVVGGRWSVVGGRAILGALGTAGLLAVLSIALFGWPVHLTFLREVLPATGAGTVWVENQTFNGFLNRLLSPDRIALVPDGGGAVRLATYAWALALTALTAWLTRPGGGLRPDIGYGLWIVALLLILPAAWIHYEALLLIPFFQAFVLARDREQGLGWPAVACYTLAWALLAHGNLWTFFDRSLHGPFWQLVLSYKFYGMLLLYGAIVLAGAREHSAMKRDAHDKHSLRRPQAPLRDDPRRA